jgi:hypothetical protein
MLLIFSTNSIPFPTLLNDPSTKSHNHPFRKPSHPPDHPTTHLPWHLWLFSSTISLLLTQSVCYLQIFNNKILILLICFWGRAIAQVVSHRLPNVAARVWAWVKSCGVCGGRSGTGAGFLQVFRFPLPILIPLTAPHSSSSVIWDWYSRPNSGWCTKWTQSHPTPRGKKTNMLLNVWQVVCQRDNWEVSLTQFFCTYFKDIMPPRLLILSNDLSFEATNYKLNVFIMKLHKYY